MRLSLSEFTFMFLFLMNMRKLFTWLRPLKNMKNAESVHVMRARIVDVVRVKLLLKINPKQMRNVGSAYASCEKVNPKMIFSLCCSGGGMS